ncbi:MAG: heme-copper oxidase subunit III [Synechococcales cyanobacterium RM1_1_8]|nr:heme-copper oxidase subunit III [Synechococcales cyanobacterium RM1_1_8]
MQGSTIDTSESPVLVAAEAQAPHSHHGDHPDHRIFGMILFLIAEGMIFLGLFAAYLTFRSVNAIPADQIPERELLLPGINTVLLVASSFLIHPAEDAIKANDVKAVRKWFGLAAVLGAIFILGQGYEYSQLTFGLRDSLFASTFYILTGFHGLHVMLGLGAIVAVLWRSREPGHYSSESHFGIAAAELYWHFVDVVWIVLFVLLYLL